jgi:hypothetical protein
MRGKVVDGYECPACEELYGDYEDARRCCRPQKVEAVDFGVLGLRKVNSNEHLCLKCRNRDAENRRYPPCPELSFSANFYVECEHYEYTER